MKTAQIKEFFARMSATNPNPTTELAYVNLYSLLVAVVLSAQATDKSVNKATKSLFAIADTPEKMLALGEAKLRDHIKTIGLYRNKAKNVILLSEQLMRDHAGEVPRTRDELVKLAGVGRKTANVVLNVGFGEETFPVDTHVFRLANRCGLAQGKTTLDVEQSLDKLVPKPYRQGAHHWLILHGRYVCKARKPDCANCAVHDLCAYESKTA